MGRGWSRRLVHEILGAPDDFCPRPDLRSVSLVELYSGNRTEDAESDPAVGTHLQEIWERRQARSAVGSDLGARRDPGRSPGGAPKAVR